ncbi:hypothetical protein L2E82_31426 [Cichorium intybus]|uniref:Uncharacterized protein n=1 Tax=Cichorium intybus TaxID=13427 RepID=A0ACB9D3I6_CICIN|nr:hypothetical protein L2E82_31426 [Cichorium intybus]
MTSLKEEETYAEDTPDVVINDDRDSANEIRETIPESNKRKRTTKEGNERSRCRKHLTKMMIKENDIVAQKYRKCNYYGMQLKSDEMSGLKKHVPNCKKNLDNIAMNRKIEEAIRAQNENRKRIMAIDEYE